MSKCIKLAVFTFIAAFVFGFIISENVNGMGHFGTDENGRQVNVIDVDKYLKQNPYRPPARKPASKPKPRPVAKKPAPKPKPVAKKPVPKPPAPKPVAKKPYKEFSLDRVAGKTIGGGVIGGALAPFSGGTSVPVGAGLGAAGGALWEGWDWAWENKGRFYQDAVEQAGKIAKVEDPMGKSFPH